MRQLLRRIPGVVTIYRHTCVLARMAYEGWWADRRRLNDRSFLRQQWDAGVPAEQERYARVLTALTEQLGEPPWGEVLEVGCGEGLFTLELARRCRLVTACDVSTVACARAAERCAAHPHVRVSQREIEKDSISGKFDVVFAMGVLEYIHGRDRLDRVTHKLAEALRGGGILVLNSSRLPPDMEGAWWARWLGEGGLHHMAFLEGRHGLRLFHREIHPAYVAALYQKAGTADATR